MGSSRRSLAGFLDHFSDPARLGQHPFHRDRVLDRQPRAAQPPRRPDIAGAKDVEGFPRWIEPAIAVQPRTERRGGRRARAIIRVVNVAYQALETVAGE